MIINKIFNTVWAKTYARFNLTTEDLQPFFSGPGFFAWQRMGNVELFCIIQYIIIYIHIYVL